MEGSRSQPTTSLARTARDTHTHTHTHKTHIYTQTLILYFLAEATMIPFVNEVFIQSPSRVIPYPTLTAINLKL